MVTQVVHVKAPGGSFMTEVEVDVEAIELRDDAGSTNGKVHQAAVDDAGSDGTWEVLCSTKIAATTAHRTPSGFTAIGPGIISR